MEYWKKISICVCLFGFLKEFRPSEPFIFEFLVGPWRHITAEEINQKVFPVNVFSYLSQLVIVFLITDLCRYKPLIILLGCCGVIIWSMLLWTKSLLELQVVEAIYGTYLATEVAYYTYIYAKVPKEYYQQVTSHVRAVLLAGKASSALTSQLLVTFKLTNYRDLNFITLTAQIAATIWAFALPSVNKSIYFNQENLVQKTKNKKAKITRAFALLWQHFFESYSKVHVIKWSFWWSLSTCLSLQIQNYMQPLWFQIQEDDTNIFNGAVEALSMILGTLGALLAGRITINSNEKMEVLLTFSSVLQGAVLLYTSQTKYIYASYACYIVFNVLYQFTITVVSSEVVKHISEDTYGLVFGLNTLLALIFQTLLNISIVDGSVGLGMSPRDQYLVYGTYSVIIAVIYFVTSIVSLCKKKMQDNAITFTNS